MTDKELTRLQAYEAMVYFLENLYALTHDRSLSEFLGYMEILSDGKPADAAYWEDWERAVEKALSNQTNQQK
jgi:hypothetical protein